MGDNEVFEVPEGYGNRLHGFVDRLVEGAESKSLVKEMKRLALLALTFLRGIAGFEMQPREAPHEAA